ncbi:hypothetical protein HHI36_004061 [Cryptolaemus montrouzieri]|uniref:Uncharacterized protein n=1 Tax=Cryptolaemus montrouzieri TaxID=559131 RepID=A0ABD2NQB3_9CUCU
MAECVFQDSEMKNIRIYTTDRKLNNDKGKVVLIKDTLGNIWCLSKLDEEKLVEEMKKQITPTNIDTAEELTRKILVACEASIPQRNPPRRRSYTRFKRLQTRPEEIQDAHELYKQTTKRLKLQIRKEKEKNGNKYWRRLKETFLD